MELIELKQEFYDVMLTGCRNTHIRTMLGPLLNINAQLRQTEIGLQLRSNIDVTSFAVPEQDVRNSNSNPMLRSFRADATTVVELGKPTLLNSIDDVSSNKRLQFEVTVTKIK